MSKSQTEVSIRVVDVRTPKRTRLRAQGWIQDGSGFRALKGFTDRAACAHRWRRFRLSTAKVVWFQKGVRPMVLARKLELRVGGRPYRPHRRSR